MESAERGTAEEADSRVRAFNCRYKKEKRNRVDTPVRDVMSKERFCYAAVFCFQVGRCQSRERCPVGSAAIRTQAASTPCGPAATTHRWPQSTGHEKLNL